MRPSVLAVVLSGFFLPAFPVVASVRGMSASAMIVNDQLLEGDSIIVSRVITDLPARITIHLKADGKPGELFCATGPSR